MEAARRTIAMPARLTLFRGRVANIISTLLPVGLLLVAVNSHAQVAQTESVQPHRIDGHSMENYNFSLVGRFERSDGVTIKGGNRKTGVMLNPTTKCSFIFPDNTSFSVGQEYGI